jgi:uncharacterized protein (TIGR03067 family)
MGTVWLAEHLVMNRPVAIKVIRPDLLARPGATSRFLREVRAAAKLHHPNIVTAFDAEPVGNSCLLVMEYVPGKTLGERLESGPLPVAEACRVIRDAARGLAHAHAAGLVHRDVKPHNLIRAADGTTKVLDFGLAAVGAGEVIPASGDGLTGAGMVVGTPDYIAPEQIADPHAADARADIYGLGCTFYHLLAGRPPLPDGSVSEKLAAQQEREPDPIPALAAEIAAVLAKMLAKRAEDRQQTAEEVVNALNRIIDNVRPTPPAKELRQENRWSLAAVLLAGAIVVATGVVFKIQRDNQVITVATDDDDLEVVMKRKGEVLRVIDKKSGQTWEIDTEKNQIALADGAGGLSLDLPDGKSVVLRRQGKAVFTVMRERTPAVAGAGDDQQPKIDAATRAAEAWLKLLDTGDSRRAWNEGAAQLHRAIPRDDMIRMHETMQKFGKLQSRSIVRRQYPANLRGSPESECVGIEYQARYGLDRAVSELLFVVLAPDGHWRVASYSFNSRGGLLGDPNAKPLSSGTDALLDTLRSGPAAVPRLSRTIRTIQPVYNLAFVPFGNALLAGSRANFTIYDPATGKRVFGDDLGFASTGMTLAVSNDSRTAAVESGDIFLYDLVAYKRVAVISKQVDGDNIVPVTSMSLTPDGQRLAYGVGRETNYYDRATGQVEHTRPADDKVHTVTVRYSPDGRYLVDAAQNKTDSKTRFTIRNAKTHEVLGSRQLAGLYHGVQFDKYSKQIFVTGPALFAVIGLPAGEVIEQEEHLPTKGAVLIPSPDGTLLAVARKEGDVQIWDRAKARVVRVWTPHPGGDGAPKPGFSIPPRVAFAPNGRTLATAHGNEIKIWDLAADGPAAASDSDLILGTWRGVAAEVGGEAMPQELIDTVQPTLTFTADKVIAKPQGRIPKPFLEMAVSKGVLPKEAASIVEKGTEGIYHLDPTKSPRQIDFTILGEIKRTGLGIYQLDGDTLKVCLSIDPAKVDQRPNEFATKEGEMRVLLTFKRQTGAELPKNDTPPAPKK